MQGVWLNVRGVLEQTIQNVHRFPDSTGNEVSKQSYIGVGDMVISNATIATIANVVFREQIVFKDLKLTTVSCRCFSTAPAPR